MGRTMLQRSACLAVGLAVWLQAPHRLDAGECTLVPGRVGFRGLEVVPSAPVVGNRVELRFDVDFAVYSVARVTVTGVSPLLDGETSHRSSYTTFVLDALEAGVTTVQLEVAYDTEEYCDAGYWIVGPRLTATSPTYELTIATGTSATATATPTATETPIVVCTPPPCTDGALVCPDLCPGGCGTICRSAEDLPDLIPSSASVVLPAVGCVDDYSEIPPPETIFCVRNQGVSASGGFDVVLESEEPQRLGGLAAGAEECLTGPFFGSSVTIDADPDDEIPESDETNNVQTLSFFVPTTTPPPICTSTATATPTPTGGTAGPTPPHCPGDCNRDGSVSITELILGVSIALQTQTIDYCLAMDSNGDGRISVAEILRAVRANLEGCA